MSGPNIRCPRKTDGQPGSWWLSQGDSGRGVTGTRQRLRSAGILGVCIGGDRATGYEMSKTQFLREIPDRNPNPELDNLEQDILKNVEWTGHWPDGFRRKTTLLGVKICAANRCRRRISSASVICAGLSAPGRDAGCRGKDREMVVLRNHEWTRFSQRKVANAQGSLTAAPVAANVSRLNLLQTHSIRRNQSERTHVRCYSSKNAARRPLRSARRAVRTAQRTRTESRRWENAIALSGLGKCFWRLTQSAARWLALAPGCHLSGFPPCGILRSHNLNGFPGQFDRTRPDSSIAPHH